MLQEVFNDSHDPNKEIFNFSSYELSDVKKSVLCKGLNFLVKPKSIKYSEFLPFWITILRCKTKKFVKWGFVLIES